MKQAGIAVLLCALALPAAAAQRHHRKHTPGLQAQSLTVTATAYNSTVKQTKTDGDPRIGAWGDRLDQLKPGFRAIAVSPDLADKGLHHKRRVRIQGFKGEFLVLDRTPAQWQNTVDIFMGGDVDKARHFGRKQLKIFWMEPKAPSTAAQR